MKKSYHSMVVPTRLARATRRTSAGDGSAVLPVVLDGLCVIADSLRWSVRGP
ncbi:hypothetical protein Acsp06_38150 [Actinomycetospora sp. NBRC 106375]|nr:hypothetical protein Acsp06_38150 [Actinomycetospora sp. NBRC 106375]